MTKFLVYFLALAFTAECAFGQAAGATGGAASPSGPAAAASDNTSPSRLSDDNHKLMAGDKLSFLIKEDREKEPKSLMVTDSGDLDVPYIGRVSVAGKTCRQIGEEIKALLEKEYYYRATVTIGLDQVSKTLGRVYVMGQVRQQGAIEIPPNENFTVGKAILRAGGFADFANKKKVKLIRNTPEGKAETFDLNMEAILQDGKIDLDVTVKADDYIVVPSRAINF